jgi:hypothetical protein
VLEKMPDRLFEHPATVLVMTNMYYAEAPWLKPYSVNAATSLVWHELSLTRNTAQEFEAQITDLGPFLTEHWRVRQPDQRQSGVRKAGGAGDLSRGPSPPGSIRCARVAASPTRNTTNHRLAAPSGARAARVQGAPRDCAAGAGTGTGRTADHDPLARQRDPGLKIIQRIWPGETPFTSTATRSCARPKRSLAAPDGT